MMFIYIIIALIIWIGSGIMTNKMFIKDNGNWIDFDEKLANIFSGIPGLIYYIVKYRILRVSNF